MRTLANIFLLLATIHITIAGLIEPVETAEYILDYAKKVEAIYAKRN